ncbi:hypothetical protein BGZ80_007908 [Entomortierella chlamydospora]|uniref:RGS domain-containing protein n=1 Tax=Entomortierella chlamydospora TaxID=101097 RepID=A0A9P6MDW7_9FUNG|nr:hypothetical protein BGZ80_007908 [Entomortierella chlamydospora]
MSSSSQSITSNTTRLNLILSNAILREMFKNFLKQNICYENLEFYLEVLDYKDKFNTLINSTRAYTQAITGQDLSTAGTGTKEVSPSNLRELEMQICTQAFAIYETYLMLGSPKELNLPHQMRHGITAYMQAVVQNMEALPSTSLASGSSPEPASSVSSTSTTPTSPSSTQDREENGERKNSDSESELIHISLFDCIHEHIFRLMSTDSVPKFTKTDKYREVMMNRVRQRDSMNNKRSSNGLGSNVSNGLRSPLMGNEYLEWSVIPGV